MLTLLTFPAAFSEPAASPFCVKAMYLLNAAGQEWQREDMPDPRRMPHGKLPVLRSGSTLIHDSDGIRDWLEAQGAEFDAGLSALDKSNARAFIRMAEEHMYFHLVLDRWGRDDVWPTIRDTYFRVIPKPLRQIVTSGIRKTLLRAMNGQGLGRMTDDERAGRLEQDLKAIATRLEASTFLFADHPTSADMSLAPMLGAMRATPVATPLRQRIAQDPLLSGYIDRTRSAMMPE